VEYIARLVEEEELEDDDKKEGVKGMLEGFLPMKVSYTVYPLESPGLALAAGRTSIT
jgi:hypothetical protein